MLFPVRVDPLQAVFVLLAQNAIATTGVTPQCRLRRRAGLYQSIDHRFLPEAELSASTIEQYRTADACYDCSAE
jgi:hypothetical protein